jgi:hypothetical protein
MENKWNLMTDIDKEPYELLASKDRERYNSELEAYELKIAEIEKKGMEGILTIF